MATSNAVVHDLVQRGYEHGFVTAIEQDTLPPGLGEETVRAISARKGEPEWMLDWRLKAYRHWLSMEEPAWASVHYPPIDYQAISYYAAPRTKDAPKSLDEVDPELLRTYEKLGIPLEEQKPLAGVAVDAVFDSVSVATTFKREARRGGRDLLLVLRGGPRASRAGAASTWARSCRTPTTSSPPSIRPCSATAPSCYVPKGVRCPMELSTYFRINAAKTGQFERTLIVAEDGAYVSYLEGCTAPQRDENQLHAAVVELVALDDATDQVLDRAELVPGRREGRGGIYNFVTKRGDCRGARSKISWTQVETGSAITWKYPSCILQGDDSVGEFYSVALTNGPPAGRHRHQDDPHRPQHALDHRLQGHFGRRGKEHLPRPGAHRAARRERPQLHPVRLAAARRPLRRPTPSPTSRCRTPRRRSSTRRRPRRSARTSCSTAARAGSPPRTRWR